MEIKVPEDPTIFKYKALQWAASFETACFFDSNVYADEYSAFEIIIAAGSKGQVAAFAGDAFAKLDHFLDNTSGYRFGFLGYDLKNEVEALSSENADGLNFPDLFFFEPEHILQISGSDLKILSADPSYTLAEISKVELRKELIRIPEIYSRYNREEYLSTISAIKQHISRGDIYEMNFCQEFYSENADIDPVATFIELNRISPTPFAGFLKSGDNYILSASPERFLSRRADKLISQPIKGTAKRSDDQKVDEALKAELRNNLKEQAENVMIVDLVRNDLTKCAVPATVKVEELFGIYSFEQVHQMISTISCQAKEGFSNADILKAVFPMGSMTGAPKVSAMQLIEKFERTKRGVFSGALGYFAPNGDFDFNVVIRTLLYNQHKHYLSFQAGSAITYESDAGKEYEECLLKTSAIRRVLGQG